MKKQDRMLQLVLNDADLVSYYEYNSDDFMTIQDALNAENIVVQVVAKIIYSIRNDDKSKQKEVYTEIFNELKNNLL